MMKILFPLFSCVILMNLGISCSGPEANVQEQTISDQPVQLSEAGYHLPDRTGYDLFLSNCGICHSYRYIQMQPAFSRKTWEKTVDKMIKTFGAPIPDSSVVPIVDYLMAARGKKD